jgi:hypothetical protein
MSPLDKVFRQSLGGVGQRDLEDTARVYSPFRGSPTGEKGAGSGLFRGQSPKDDRGSLTGETREEDLGRSSHFLELQDILRNTSDDTPSNHADNQEGGDFDIEQERESEGEREVTEVHFASDVNDQGSSSLGALRLELRLRLG